MFAGRQQAKLSLNRGSAGLQPLPALAPLCTYGFTTINIFFTLYEPSKSLSSRYSSPTAVGTNNKIDSDE